MGGWLTENFHAQKPFLFDYNNGTRYPNIRAPCSIDGYLVYSVDARTASDVQATVNFRIVVKVTGHDFQFEVRAARYL